MTAHTSPSWLENAVLIYGPRKGGTTLFQNLLDGADGLFMYPAELKLKMLAGDTFLSKEKYLEKSKVPGNEPPVKPEATADGTWDNATYYRHTREYNVSKSVFDRAAYEADWASDSSAPQDVVDLVRKDAVRVFNNSRYRNTSPLMWCAKEVGGRPALVLDLWKRIFPKGKLLLITRDSLMVTRSVLMDRRRVNERPSLYNLFKQTYEPMAVNANIARLKNNPDVHVLRYEDLVAQPEHVMRGVAAFLGLPFTPKLIEPTVLGEPAVVRTASRPATGIFQSQATWKDGLSLREQIVCSSLHKVLSFWPALAGGR